MERVFGIRVVFILAGFLLIIKAADLQLFDSSYRAKAEATALSKKVLYPSRGLIYAQGNRLLVQNEPKYDLYVINDQLDPEMDIEKFCGLLEITREVYEKNLNKDFSSPLYSRKLPFPFLTKIENNIYARFQEYLYEFPGFYPQLRAVRGYPQQNASHILGYISEVDQKTIDNSNGVYELGDYIGTNGLELEYEEILRGSKGLQYILKDNLGREVGPYLDGKLDYPATSGMDVHTSIDLDLQMYVEKLFQNKVGALVAIEPSTGQILAMASSPTYDPQLLTIHQNRAREFEKLARDTLSPFFDRTVMAKYPPGSTFKPLIALIAMQEGVLRPDTRMFCNGTYLNVREVKKCRNHPAPTNVARAIQYSCNSYFFQTFRNIIDQYGFSSPNRAYDKFVQHLDDFGLGHILETDNVNEGPGNVPDSKYFDDLYGENAWRSTYIISLGIGQGEIELNTLQMANYASILANRGWFITPHLLKSFGSSSDQAIPEHFTTRKYVKIDPEYFEPVIDGLELVVLAGTARIASIQGISVCGKTGTVENPHGEDHSSFIAFAPKEDPQIAIAAYVENAGGGGRYAAPISSLVIEKYLNNEIQGNRKWLETQMIEANLIIKP